MKVTRRGWMWMTVAYTVAWPGSWNMGLEVISSSGVARAQEVPEDSQAVDLSGWNAEDPVTVTTYATDDDAGIGIGFTNVATGQEVHAFADAETLEPIIPGSFSVEAELTGLLKGDIDAISEDDELIDSFADLLSDDGDTTELRSGVKSTAILLVGKGSTKACTTDYGWFKRLRDFIKRIFGRPPAPRPAPPPTFPTTTSHGGKWPPFSKMDPVEVKRKPPKSRPNPQPPSSSESKPLLPPLTDPEDF